MQNLEIFAKTVSGGTLNQIYTLIGEAPFRDCRVRIMPDTHVGIGAVVGFTSTMNDKIIPNVIGVDIGCGMRIYDLGHIDFSLCELDNFIKSNIPSGSNVRKEHAGEELIASLLCHNYLTDHDRLYGSLGTLGGGNHFIEVDVGQDGRKYLVIHTGSRNLGTQIARIYQKMAIKSCKTASEGEREEIISHLSKEGRQDEIPDALIALTEKYSHKTKIQDHLCYLEGHKASSYLHDMRICQKFAEMNRAKIGECILKHLRLPRADYFESVHNFIGDDNIIRKGAIPAYQGQRVLIPMNMRDGCILGIGLGNPDWNYSAPHGAGRLLSRTDAKKNLSLEEFKSEMKDIYTTTATAATIDESPMAYKPMDEIIELISPTVEITEIIKPIYNFKASD